MKFRKSLVASATLVIAIAGTLPAQEKVKQESTTDDRAAIEKSIQSYVAACNARDIDTTMAHWAPAGVYVDRASGQRVAGHDELKKTFQAAFKSHPKDSRLDVAVESIEFVSPSVAMEQGISTITQKGGEPIVSSYTTVHVLRDGKWLIDRVSEHEIVEPPSHFEQLKELEWLIGNWTDQAGKGVVSTECHWARNNNFIVRSFTVAIAGEVDMAGMQVIGWDPANKQIRSWTFDSDGGFNHGTWKKVGDAWSAQTTATLPNGELASSTSVLTPVDENSFTWQQVNRVVAGKVLPNLEEIVVVRTSAN